MNTVEAVKVDEIGVVERKLILNGSQVCADIWKIGINLALRISDLLSLTYNDVAGDTLIIREGKTNKPRTIKINAAARDVINRRRSVHPDHVFLFQATGNRVSGKVKPVSRQYVAQQFKLVGDEIGVNLSTHSMRKTRGMAMYKAGIPLEQIAKVLNHSTPAVTMRYIGLTQKSVDDTYDQFCL